MAKSAGLGGRLDGHDYGCALGISNAVDDISHAFGAILS
jgi:hypothetical protein